MLCARRRPHVLRLVLPGRPVALRRVAKPCLPLPPFLRPADSLHLTAEAPPRQAVRIEWEPSSMSPSPTAFGSFLSFSLLPSHLLSLKWLPGSPSSSYLVPRLLSCPTPERACVPHSDPTPTRTPNFLLPQDNPRLLT